MQLPESREGRVRSDGCEELVLALRSTTKEVARQVSSLPNGVPLNWPSSNFLVVSLIAFAPPAVAVSVSVLSSRCRGFAADSVAASALRNKLCAAHAAANKVRLLTTLTSLSVAWIIGVYANASFILEVELHPRGTLDVFVGILAAALGTTIDRSWEVA